MADQDSPPVLIACAHGTAQPEGRQRIGELLDAVRQQLPGVEVREAYVDGHGPSLTDVVSAIRQRDHGVAAVIVPLLLAAGDNEHVDISRAVAGRTDVLCAPVLGPDERLVEVVRARLFDEGTSPDMTVVLAVGGSSDPRSHADAETAADSLRASWRGPVRVGYAAGDYPSVADSVRAARSYGEDLVAVASYHLVPSELHAELAGAGADIVTPPLGAHPLVVDVVCDRYRALAR
jgi:sirohydrochlorin ferrochelatase